MGRIILMGDFNGRTCTSPDFIVNDNMKYISVPNSYISDKEFLRRRSEDRYCKNNTYGNSW